MALPACGTAVITGGGKSLLNTAEQISSIIAILKNYQNRLRAGTHFNA